MLSPPAISPAIAEFLENMLCSVDIVSPTALQRSEGQHDIHIRGFLRFKRHVHRMPSITELLPSEVELGFQANLSYIPRPGL